MSEPSFDYLVRPLMEAGHKATDKADEVLEAWLRSLPMGVLRDLANRAQFTYGLRIREASEESKGAEIEAEKQGRRK